MIRSGSRFWFGSYDGQVLDGKGPCSPTLPLTPTLPWVVEVRALKQLLGRSGAWGLAVTLLERAGKTAQRGTETTRSESEDSVRGSGRRAPRDDLINGMGLGRVRMGSMLKPCTPRASVPRRKVRWRAGKKWMAEHAPFSSTGKKKNEAMGIGSKVKWATSYCPHFPGLWP